jgi:hypothetical protein
VAAAPKTAAKPVRGNQQSSRSQKLCALLRPDPEVAFSNSPAQMRGKKMFEMAHRDAGDLGQFAQRVDLIAYSSTFQMPFG